MAFRDKIGSEAPDSFTARRRIDRRLKIEHTREQTADVCLDDRDRLIESERRNRVCGVTTETGESADLIDVLREDAPVLSDDDFRGGVQIAGTRVITKPLPRVQHVGIRGARKAGEIGEAVEPASIIWNDRGDLRLLEHEFGDKNRVGIGRVTPRQVAAVFPIPCEKGAAEKADARRRVCDDERNVQRPTLNVQRSNTEHFY